MTVTLKKGTGASAQSVTICDGAEYAGTPGKWVGPLGEQVSNCEWRTQAAEYIGAEDATPKNFGNRRFEVPLRVSAVFATEDEAWDAYYGLAASLPYDGSSLEIVTDGGATISYARAEIARLRMSVAGVAVVADYTFLAASPTVTPPPTSQETE